MSTESGGLGRANGRDRAVYVWLDWTAKTTSYYYMNQILLTDEHSCSYLVQSVGIM